MEIITTFLFSTFHIINCRHCGTALGRMYRTTSRELDLWRGQYTYSSEVLSFYELSAEFDTLTTMNPTSTFITNTMMANSSNNITNNNNTNTNNNYNSPSNDNIDDSTREPSKVFNHVQSSLEISKVMLPGISFFNQRIDVVATVLFALV